jgi:hypothetical protein
MAETPKPKHKTAETVVWYHDDSDGRSRTEEEEHNWYSRSMMEEIYRSREWVNISFHDPGNFVVCLIGRFRTR